MFFWLWNFVTFQWWKLELPSTDPFKLNKHYVCVIFNPSKYEDKKKMKKAYHLLVGGRGHKRLASEKKLQRCIPEQLQCLIELYTRPGYREHKGTNLASLEEGDSVAASVESRHFEKIADNPLFWPNGSKVISNRGFGPFSVGSGEVLLMKFYLEQNLDKLKKTVPETCANCGHPTTHLLATGLCIGCYNRSPAVNKVLKKHLGTKIFNGGLSVEECVGRLSKSKYKEFLLEQDTINLFGVSGLIDLDRPHLEEMPDEDYEDDDEPVPCRDF